MEHVAGMGAVHIAGRLAQLDETIATAAEWWLIGAQFSHSPARS